MSAPLDIRFFVAGEPLSKGNHDAFPIDRGPCTACVPGKRCGRRNCIGGRIVGAVVTDDGGKALEAWQGLIRVYAISARNAAGARVVTRPGALEMFMVFLRRRPDAHYTGRGALSAEGMRHPTPDTKPDWDKLARAVGDALTDATKKGLAGALAEDDSQITSAHVGKAWTEQKPGVLIRARLITKDPAWVLEELVAAGLAAATTQGALL
jgi:Holliday junction resolvase RusA-like endonuclease